MTYAHHNWNWFAEVRGPTGTTRSTAPYQTNFVVMDEHCGTHFDAPTHFVPPEGSGLDLAGPLGDQTGDKVPLEDLMGPAAVIDVRFLAGEPGVSPFITADHVREWEEEQGALRAERSCSSGQTGTATMSRARRARSICAARSLPASILAGRRRPPRPPSTCTKVVSRPIGIDAPSIGSAHDGVPVHQEGLSRGMRYVEMLTNLGELPVRGAYFIFMPVKIARSSGGPGRAMALLPGKRATRTWEDCPRKPSPVW